MKRLFLLVLMALVIAGTAFADTIPTCTGSGTPNVLSGDFSCTLGGLTFSDFKAVDNANTPTPVVNLFMTAVEGADGTVNLFFNPNLTAAAGSVADILFYFTVTGGITQIDLSVGGSHATINETACASQFTLGSTSCSAEDLLANIHAGSGQTATSSLFDPTSPVYIAKDINLNNTEGTTDNVLSEFNQSFTPPVPEPASLVLLGSGLLTLGSLVRRKINL